MLVSANVKIVISRTSRRYEVKPEFGDVLVEECGHDFVAGTTEYCHDEFLKTHPTPRQLLETEKLGDTTRINFELDRQLTGGFAGGIFM